MGGGIAQAYSTMGFCTFMKTVEVTRQKSGRFKEKEKKKREDTVGINMMCSWNGIYFFYRCKDL